MSPINLQTPIQLNSLKSTRLDINFKLSKSDDSIGQITIEVASMLQQLMTHVEDRLKLSKGAINFDNAYGWLNSRIICLLYTRTLGQWGYSKLIHVPIICLKQLSYKPCKSKVRVRIPLSIDSVWQHSFHMNPSCTRVLIENSLLQNIEIIDE